MIIHNSRPGSFRMWIPHSQPGLENSSRIIPQYYLTNKNLHGNIFKIDYLEMIRDDILNLRPLSEEQINYIEKIPEDEKMELIKCFNETYKSLAYIL